MIAEVVFDNPDEMAVGTVALRELVLMSKSSTWSTPGDPSGLDVSITSELDDNRFFKWVASGLAVGRSYQPEKSKAAQET